MARTVILLVAVASSWLAAAEEKSHWAFVPPTRDALPEGSQPVDHFIRARLATAGLQPSPPAPKHTLIRRLSFDLRGIPPAWAEVEQFLADDSPDAWEKLVERFLASPHFGERLAQDWLDLARYADTSGYAADRTRNMWVYRDWLIDSINNDKRFDQFTIAQLAGDLLPNPGLDDKIATGFHRNAMQAKGNNPRKEEFRVKTVVDRLMTTGRTWLGLTLECAECHDHKHDPISQKEYYQLFAIFNNVPHLGQGYDTHGPLMDFVPDAKTGQRKQSHEHSAKRETGKPIKIPVMEELSDPRETHLHLRGNFKEKGERVYPGVPAVLPPLPAGRKGTRLDFARWLTRPEHPLTARVAVNYLWQHFFGTGLVATPADFGTQGAPPSHPELLDWLAVEFVERGWSRKHLVRFVVNSDTYRQSSATTPQVRERDPNNRLLARMSRLRLPAEQIRDNALSVSGLLVPTVGGPSVFPPQPKGLYEERGQNEPGNSNFTWVDSAGEGRYRKSMYTYWKRMMLHPSLAVFDGPDRQVCSAKRTITNTPRQALATLNDPIYHECAQVFARRITAAATGEGDRIRFAFRTCLSRDPDQAESNRLGAFLRAGADDPWLSLASVLLNLDESLTRE